MSYSRGDEAERMPDERPLRDMDFFRAKERRAASALAGMASSASTTKWWTERRGSALMTCGSQRPLRGSPSTERTTSPTIRPPSSAAAEPGTTRTSTFFSLTSMPKPRGVRRTGTMRERDAGSTSKLLLCIPSGTSGRAGSCSAMASSSAWTADTRWVQGTRPRSSSAWPPSRRSLHVHHPSGGAGSSPTITSTNWPRRTDSSALSVSPTKSHSTKAGSTFEELAEECDCRQNSAVSAELRWSDARGSTFRKAVDERVPASQPSTPLPR
eukprot:scaffold12486_cov112-Isochrysis_galbana.AAC.1